MIVEEKNDVWVVIAAFNEGPAIARTVQAVTTLGYQAIVVDDGSSDQTAHLAAMAGAHVLRHTLNLGQGAALQTGLRFALEQKAKYLVTFDADNQHKASEIEAMLTPLRQGHCEITLGTRFGQGGQVVNIDKKKLLTLRMAIFFTRLTTKLDITDTHNGFRAMTAQAATKLRITQNRMAHASEILHEIRNKKLSYQEVPVTIIYTIYSKSKGQKISNSLNILWESMQSWFVK